MKPRKASSSTGIRKTEESLRKESSLLRAIMDSQRSVNIFALDREYRYTEFSRSHKEVIKNIWGVDITVGMNMLEIIKEPTDRVRAKHNFDLSLAGQYLILEEEYGDEARYRTYYENRYSPILEPDGSISGLTVFVIEITKRKQAQESLRQSEKRFRNMFQQISSIAIQGYSPDGTTQYWNKASELLYGYSAEEAVGCNLLDLIIPPEMRPDVARAIQTMIQSGKPIPPGELTLLRKDGSRIPVFSNHTLVKIPGRPDELYCVDIDLTELKQMENQLRLQSGALQAAANAIVITDNKGVILWANSAFTTFTGYSISEVVGKTPAVLKSGKHKQSYYKKLWDTILSGAVWRGELVNRRKDGTFYTEEMTITPLKDKQNNVTHFIAVKQDITERKLIEEKVLQTQRMDSIGTLASGVAHDINNILAPILLASDVLRTIEDPKTRDALVSSINESARRGADIVKQVLTFARGTRGEHVPMQLKTSVEDLCKIIKETFPKNFAVEVSLQPDIHPVRADPTQIHQVLLNLCLNARDAMPDGGTLTISGANMEIDESYSAMVPDAVAGSYSMLSLTDSGTGIPHDVMSKIFEPFFTTKELGKGTGLGLSTVIGIVRSHHGFVVAESEAGRGSTFKIFLPAITEDLTGTLVTAPAHSPRSEGSTLLVVDDESPIVNAISIALKNKGHQVFTAESGGAALALYRKHAKDIQLVLTDVIMPGMDGLQLARELRAISPQLKIIVSTGQASEIQYTELKKLGIQTILRKPYDVDKLLDALHGELHPART